MLRLPLFPEERYGSAFNTGQKQRRVWEHLILYSSFTDGELIFFVQEGLLLLLYCFITEIMAIWRENNKSEVMHRQINRKAHKHLLYVEMLVYTINMHIHLHILLYKNLFYIFFYTIHMYICIHIYSIFYINVYLHIYICIPKQRFLYVAKKTLLIL